MNYPGNYHQMIPSTMVRAWSYTQDKSRISPPIINFCGFSPLLTTKPGNISSDINISSLCMTTLSEEQRFIHRKSLRHLFRPEIVNISVYCYPARWDLTTIQRYIRERSNNITLYCSIATPILTALLIFEQPNRLTQANLKGIRLAWHIYIII